jgi:putative membrane protein
MRKHILLAAAASLALTPAAYAQMSPGGSPGKAGAAPEQTQLRPADQSFVTKAANGGMFEIRSSELAVDRVQNAEVKDFARQMIRDHDKANKELQSAASSLGANVPSSLDAKHAQALQKLEGMNGPEFEQFYVQAQRDAHREAVGLYSSYSKANGALSAWAAETLPTLQEHQQRIQQISRVAEGGRDVNRTGRASTQGPAGKMTEPSPATKNMKPKSGSSGGAN